MNQEPTTQTPGPARPTRPGSTPDITEIPAAASAAFQVQARARLTPNGLHLKGRLGAQQALRFTLQVPLEVHGTPGVDDRHLNLEVFLGTPPDLVASGELSVNEHGDVQGSQLLRVRPGHAVLARTACTMYVLAEQDRQAKLDASAGPEAQAQPALDVHLAEVQPALEPPVRPETAPVQTLQMYTQQFQGQDLAPPEISLAPSGQPDTSEGSWWITDNLDLAAEAMGRLNTGREVTREELVRMPYLDVSEVYRGLPISRKPTQLKETDIRFTHPLIWAEARFGKDGTLLASGLLIETVRTGSLFADLSETPADAEEQMYEVKVSMFQPYTRERHRFMLPLPEGVPKRPLLHTMTLVLALDRNGRIMKSVGGVIGGDLEALVPSETSDTARAKAFERYVYERTMTATEELFNIHRAMTQHVPGYAVELVSTEVDEPDRWRIARTTEQPSLPAEPQERQWLIEIFRDAQKEAKTFSRTDAGVSLSSAEKALQINATALGATTMQATLVDLPRTTDLRATRRTTWTESDRQNLEGPSRIGILTTQVGPEDIGAKRNGAAAGAHLAQLPADRSYELHLHIFQMEHGHRDPRRVSQRPGSAIVPTRVVQLRDACTLVLALNAEGRLIGRPLLMYPSSQVEKYKRVTHSGTDPLEYKIETIATDALMLMQRTHEHLRLGRPHDASQEAGGPERWTLKLPQDQRHEAPEALAARLERHLAYIDSDKVARKTARWMLTRHIEARKTEGWIRQTFVPRQEIARQLRENGADQAGVLANAWRLMVLVPWRVGRGVYRIDETLLGYLWETGNQEQVPSKVLMDLPEYTIYVPTPGLTLETGQPLLGFFATVDAAASPPHLHLMLEPVSPVMITVNVPLAEMLNLSELSLPDEDTFGVPQNLPLTASRCVNLLIYLCSVTGQRDLRPGERPQGSQEVLPPTPGHPVRPRVIRNAGKETLEARTAPVVWDVGVRLGRAVRTALGSAPGQERTGTGDGEPGSGTFKRPHLRRHHWHPYATGPRNQKRGVVVHWQPPIMVNFDLATDDLDDLPVVVRPVKLVKDVKPGGA